MQTHLFNEDLTQNHRVPLYVSVHKIHQTIKVSDYGIKRTKVSQAAAPPIELRKIFF